MSVDGVVPGILGAEQVAERSVAADGRRQRGRPVRGVALQRFPDPLRWQVHPVGELGDARRPPELLGHGPQAGVHLTGEHLQ
jgi:hypothetical protein